MRLGQQFAFADNDVVDGLTGLQGLAGHVGGGFVADDGVELRDDADAVEVVALAGGYCYEYFRGGNSLIDE